MNKYHYIYLIILLTVLISCKKNENFGPQTDQNTPDITITNNGAIVVNEGNFGSNNGSLSYLDFDSLKIANQIFYNSNNKYLGDVAQSITVIEDLAYIVVNHSAKIEIISTTDFSSIKTINGLISPRYICRVGLTKAYISDLYSDSLTILDLKTNTISGYINLSRSSDKMLFYNDHVYAVNWSNYSNPGVINDQIVKIDAINDIVIDSIKVSKEPNSIVLDKNNKIWILCSGGYDNTVNPALMRINPVNDQIELKLDFPDIASSPTGLTINGTGDTLYYLNNGVYQLSISDISLPQNKLVEMTNGSFYNIAVHPDDNKIIISDAKNYNSQGQIHIFNTKGELLKSLDAGIIPCDITFYQI